MGGAVFLESLRRQKHQMLLNNVYPFFHSVNRILVHTARHLFYYYPRTFLFFLFLHSKYSLKCRQIAKDHHVKLNSGNLYAIKIQGPWRFATKNTPGVFYDDILKLAIHALAG